MSNEFVSHVRIREEQARLLYRFAPLTLFGAAGLSAGTAATLAYDQGWSLLGWWLTFVLVALLLRAADHYLIGARDLLRYARRASVHSAVLGVCWGAIAPMLLPGADLLTMTTVTISAVGVLAGATICTAIWFPAFVAFTCPVIVLLAFGVARVDEQYAYLAIVGLGYGGLNLLFGAGIARVQRATLLTQIENEMLVDRLGRAKERVEAASHAKSRFFAAASHDLRQPAHAVQLYLDLLAEDPQQTDAMIDRIRHALSSLDQQLDGILDIAQLDAAVEKVELSAFDGVPWLSQIVERHQPHAQVKGLKLDIDTPTSLGVHSDARLLERIIDNLLSNALRYTESGTIFCLLEQTATDVTLVIRDTGIGIASAEQERVFEEFYQVGNPGRERDQGLGLGLAIVRRLCERLEIPLRLRSAPNEGTTVSLQLKKAALPQSADNGQAAQDSSLAGLRVLLIENDQLVAEATRQLFDSWGCVVRVAGNGTDAIAASADGFDVAIADQRLGPDESGIEVLHELARRGCPGLLVTGDTSAEALKVFDASGLPILHKPVRAAALKAAVSTIIRKASDLAAAGDQPPGDGDFDAVGAITNAE